jgi:hypothetical protein
LMLENLQLEHASIVLCSKRSFSGLIARLANKVGVSIKTENPHPVQEGAGNFTSEKGGTSCHTRSVAENV